MSNCNGGSCGRCGGCYEVMRDEFNTAADQRDDALKKLADMTRELIKRPWVDGHHILQGEHEADIGVIGLTFDGIKKDLESLQNENFDLRAKLKEEEELASRYLAGVTEAHWHLTKERPDIAKAIVAIAHSVAQGAS